MIGEKYDKKEKINQFKEQAFEYFVNKLQSSQENIKELLFDQFGLTDKKINEFSKITDEKLNEIQHQNQILSDQNQMLSDQNIYMIAQNRTIKRLLSSTVSQHQHVASDSQDIKLNSSKLTKLQIDKKTTMASLLF